MTVVDTGGNRAPFIASSRWLRPRVAPLVGTDIAVTRSLVEVEPVWRRLEAQGGSSVFQSFDMFAAWARHLAPARKVDWFVVVILDKATGDPVLLLPLMVHAVGSVRVIEAADLEVADFCGPVLARGFQPTRAQMRALWARVRDALPRADVLRLSKLQAAIAGRPNPLLLLDNVQPIKLSNFKTALDPAHSWRKRMPDKLASELTIRRRKLDKRGQVSFVTATTDKQADQFYAAMIAQRAARCTAMGRDNILDDAATRAFYRALIKPSDQAGIGVMQALLVDETIIATGFGLRHGGAFHMIFPAFQAEGWRNYSPGLHFFVASMQWSADEGLGHYDFTIGEEGFKRDLGAEEFPLYEHLVALTPRGLPVMLDASMRRTVRRSPLLSHLVTTLRRTTRPVFGAKTP